MSYKSKMEIDEFLLTTSDSSQQYSACLWDYNTLNVKKYYKNGGSVAPKCLEIFGKDYLISSELGKPRLNIWQLNGQEVTNNIRWIISEVATCMTISPTNLYLAVGMGCKLCVWHISSGKLLFVQQKHFQPISCVQFSSNGNFLLCGGQDGILIVYNLNDIISISNNYLAQSDIGQVEPIYMKNDHCMPIKDIHVGHFGQKSRFATVSSDQTCRLYDLFKGTPLLILVFTKLLTSVIFDAPCWNMFVGDEMGLIKQINLKSCQSNIVSHVNENTSLKFDGHSKKVTCLALNITYTVLASGSEDHFVFIWEIKSKQILKKIEQTGSITNIKFILGYENIFADNHRPNMPLTSLERNMDSIDEFFIKQIQTTDITLSDDEDQLDKKESRENVMDQNIKLRIINKQLYESIVNISKKYIL